MYHPTINKLITVAVLSYISPCFADRADSEKPLHLESDQVVIDEAQKTSTFTGSVQLTQGTILIQGQKIVVVQDKDGFKHGTIYGDTANFRQKREGMDEYVEGSGERIEYDTRLDEINLYGQAHVRRGLDDVRGEHITYNLKTEIFQVTGGNTSSDDTPSKRVRVVLQPKTRKNPSNANVPIDSSKNSAPAPLPKN